MRRGLTLKERTPEQKGEPFWEVKTSQISLRKPIYENSINKNKKKKKKEKRN